MTWFNELNGRLGYVLDVAEHSTVFDPTKKHDFIFTFDATNCNPNGDPDNNNLPRQDQETGLGIVTDVCLKRKIRDYVGHVFGTQDQNVEQSRYNIFVKRRGLLGKEITAIAAGMTESDRMNIDRTQNVMRNFYWDVRLFGAVLSVGKAVEEIGEPLIDLVPEGLESDPPAPRINAKKSVVKKPILNGGQCVGPLQLGFATSVEPISPKAMAIVRDARVDNSENSDNRDTADSPMPATKSVLPYALYVCEGHFSPRVDRNHLVNSADIAVFWHALRQMFDLDSSAGRPGSIRSLGCWVFTHEHELGNYPVHKLREHIRISRRPRSGHELRVARHYQDYQVEIERRPVDGVTLTTLFNDWA